MLVSESGIMAGRKRSASSSVAAAIGLLLFVVMGTEGGNIISESQNRLPRIQLIKSQIRNFLRGRNGRVTLVYQTENVQNLTVRWFRQASESNLPDAEIHNMLSINGDLRYRLSHLHSDDVTAASLSVRNIRPNEFPYRFVVVFYIGEPMMQYQLEIRVEHLTIFTRNTLDEISWMTFPPPTSSFRVGGDFAISCVARLDSESRGYNDELSLYRMYFDRKSRTRTGKLHSTLVGSIHRDRDNYVEESGQFMITGRRTPQSHGYIKYEMLFTSGNSSRKQQGAYVCGVERELDRAYVTSWVRQGRLDMRPVVQLVPCEENVLDDKTFSLQMRVGKETCFRCRAYGYPAAIVDLFKEGVNLTSTGTSRVLMDEHISVADGGVSEVTYTFRHPTRQDAGEYACIGSNNLGEAEIRFSIVTLEPPPSSGRRY